MGTLSFEAEGGGFGGGRVDGGGGERFAGWGWGVHGGWVRGVMLEVSW